MIFFLESDVCCSINPVNNFCTKGKKNLNGGSKNRKPECNEETKMETATNLHLLYG